MSDEEVNKQNKQREQILFILSSLIHSVLLRTLKTHLLPLLSCEQTQNTPQKLLIHIKVDAMKFL